MYSVFCNICVISVIQLAHSCNKSIINLRKLFVDLLIALSVIWHGSSDHIYSLNVIEIRCILIFIELYKMPVNYTNWEIIIFILQNN